jgi:glycosyltransferase involved in cell wall biosynthesis
MVASTITDNYNGYTAKLDENEYKDKIKQIISNKKQLKKVSKTAQKTLGKSWKDVAEETYQEYLKLIENKE